MEIDGGIDKFVQMKLCTIAKYSFVQVLYLYFSFGRTFFAGNSTLFKQLWSERVKNLLEHDFRLSYAYVIQFVLSSISP